MKIVLASGNKHKYEEFVRFFERLPEFRDNPIELASAWDFPAEKDRLADLEESGSSYEENSYIKARAWADCTGMPTIADDSGLEVEALGWGPGIRSARAAAGSDADRVRWLLGKLADLDKKNERRACFAACIVLALPGDARCCGRDYFSSEGRCRGTISRAPRGDNGFGYDPIFVPDGGEVTFAELSPSAKSDISHRAIAMKGMAQMMPVVLKYLLACGERRVNK